MSPEKKPIYWEIFDPYFMSFMSASNMFGVKFIDQKLTMDYMNYTWETLTTFFGSLTDID